MFSILIGLSDEYIKNYRLNKREAIRGIIIKNNKLMMIKTNRGDFKFPGGGIKGTENKTEALKREIEEESGYKVKDIGSLIGVVVERRHDLFDRNAVFEMISYYYLCEVSETRSNQRLDPYEIAQEFKPVWVDINEAILNNETLINAKSENINDWVKRETMVLKEIRRMLTEGAI